MNTSKPKAKRRRTPSGAYSGKTKFDKWLEGCILDGVTCEVVISPPAPYPYPSGLPDDCKFPVRIRDVDRYNVLVEFLNDLDDEDDDGIWWISKDSIRAASRIS